MKKGIVLISLILIAVLLLGCEVAKDDEINRDKILSGKISGQPFTFVSGVAISGIDSWDIRLYQSKSQVIIDSTGKVTYLNSYPYINFSIEKNSEPQKYSISTFGTSGKMLTGWTSELDGTFFDKGEIEILNISNTEITGIIVGETNEGTSYLSGKFVASTKAFSR